MNKKALFHPTVKCGQFALLVVLTNWHYGRSYLTKEAAYEWRIDGAMITSLIALVGLAFYGAKIWRHAKQHPDFVWDIKRMFRLVDWSPCLILLPLFLGTSSLTKDSFDGGEIVVRSGYGCANPFAAFITISVAMATYQLSKRLSKFDPTPPPYAQGGVAMSS